MGANLLVNMIMEAQPCLPLKIILDECCFVSRWWEVLSLSFQYLENKGVHGMLAERHHLRLKGSQVGEEFLRKWPGALTQSLGERERKLDYF